jgi:hypothetical protein
LDSQGNSQRAAYQQPVAKRIIFALLAYQEEHVLAAQLDNIRHYNPNAEIVLYNGGTNPEFATSLNVCKYPNSHPIVYGNLTPYLWEVMRWLEDTQTEYDYLINLDHDVLFVKHGFEAFLDETMTDADCMGWGLNTAADNPNSLPIQYMTEKWPLWQPLFRTDTYFRYFNPGQVYKHEIVRRMLSHVNPDTATQMIQSDPPFTLEETFFVTLAMACGGRVREYPDGHMYNNSVRWGSDITIPEAEQTRQHPSFYWIHPIKGQALVDMKGWLQPTKQPAKRARKLRKRIHRKFGKKISAKRAISLNRRKRTRRRLKRARIARKRTAHRKRHSSR